LSFILFWTNFSLFSFFGFVDRQKKLSISKKEIVEKTAMLNIEHKRRRLFSKWMSLVTIDECQYLVGVQIAHLLERETFNMYRSMKIKGVTLYRASPEQIEYLCDQGAIRPGTHSVTLVPYADAIYFVADVRERNRDVALRKANKHLKRSRQRKRTYLEVRPRLHRRKPLPWDVVRSLHADESEPPEPAIKAVVPELPPTIPASKLPPNRQRPRRSDASRIAAAKPAVVLKTRIVADKTAAASPSSSESSESALSSPTKAGPSCSSAADLAALGALSEQLVAAAEYASAKTLSGLLAAIDDDDDDDDDDGSDSDGRLPQIFGPTVHVH
jgi:hypothetical protein